MTEPKTFIFSVPQCIYFKNKQISSALAVKYDEVIFLPNRIHSLNGCNLCTADDTFHSSRPLLFVFCSGCVFFFSRPWKMLSINPMIFTSQKVMTRRAKPPGRDGLNNWRTNRLSFYIYDSHPDCTQGLTARDSIHNWNYLPKMPLFCLRCCYSRSPPEGMVDAFTPDGARSPGTDVSSVLREGKKDFSLCRQKLQQYYIFKGQLKKHANTLV